MKMKVFTLCVFAIGFGVYPAYADDRPSGRPGPRYMPEPDYIERAQVWDRSEVELYEEYEQREPCQYYRRMPRGYFDDCVREKEYLIIEPEQEAAPEERILPIVQSYTILFDFDKSSLRADEKETLDQIVRDISKYSPRQVTVTGYTDSSGSADYNQVLSQKREQAVSSALLERGIENQTLDRKARGEYEQAVPTADGVRNQHNRRVVVDFRR